MGDHLLLANFRRDASHPLNDVSESTKRDRYTLRLANSGHIQPFARAWCSRLQRGRGRAPPSSRSLLVASESVSTAVRIAGTAARQPLRTIRNRNNRVCVPRLRCRFFASPCAFKRTGAKER